MINRIKAIISASAPGRQGRLLNTYLGNPISTISKNCSIIGKSFPFQEFDIKSIILKVEEEAKAIPAAGTVAEYVDLVMDLLRVIISRKRFLKYMV